MMTVEEKIKMYKEKKAFVEAINAAFQVEPRKHSIQKVEYELYKMYMEYEDFTYFNEFLVVTFDGGSISVRCANGNSCTANFREIGKLIDGGYYNEVEFYRALVPDCGFEKVEL